MKILLWLGNESNQKALANRINEQFPLTGIILESRIVKRKYSFKKIINKIYEKTFLSEIDKAWWGMKEVYDKSFPSNPKDVQILNVENINSEEAYNFSLNMAPDLILVSGTRLIKEKMLSLKPSIGILNLHTGLSPYIKGGPNCTNWCIAANDFHLIGNTIMWIDLGIDSGNILTTEYTPINGEESFSDLHLKVMNHAHELYIKAIRHLNEGGKSNVPQDEIGTGKTYYTRDWGLKQKKSLISNYPRFQEYIKSQRFIEDRKNIKTIQI